MIKRFLTAAVAGVVALVLAAPSQAGFVLNVAETTPGTVTISYSGSFDFVGSGIGNPHTSTGTVARVREDQFFYRSQDSSAPSKRFEGSYTGGLFFPGAPTSAGSPPPPAFAGTASVGSQFLGFYGPTSNTVENTVLVDGTFAGNGTYSASGVLTFSGRTLSDFGFTAVGQSRSYTWTQNGTTNTQSITINAVPEPGSLAVVSGVVAGLSVLSRRRRQG